MMRSTMIRTARSADLPLLADLGAALAAQHAEYDPSRFIVPSAEEFRSFFSRELANPDAFLLVAESENSLVGYAFLRLEPPSLVDLADETIWLHDIYILPAARGRGAGRALIQRAFDLTRQHGGKRLLLKVSPKNTTAARSFEKAGFRTTMLEMQIDLPPL